MAYNDDLVFDQDGKQSFAQTLIETRQQDSMLHRIKRQFWNIFGSGPTTTVTESPTDGEDKTKDDPEEELPVKLNENEKLQVANLEKIRREDEEDERDNAIGPVAEGRRDSAKFRSSDDEDLAGSGEVEGSAGDGGPHHPGSTTAQRKYYRITLTVGEPYIREYADRNSREYKELSGNLTQALEELYTRHLPAEDHAYANVVKISPTTTDSFTSQVTLDIGSTFTDELEVRNILENQLKYHSLGNIQVRPEGFSFRIFQAGKDEGQVECDPSIELTCKNGACVPLDSRCDGVTQCEDGSDELDCRETTQSYVESELPVEPTEKPEGEEEKEEVEHEGTGKYDGRYDENTLRSTADKCRADDTVRCSDGSRYICSVQQCDGVPDCEDGGDELDCPHPGCSAGEFACDVSRCILESQRCNFVPDCHDESDEHDCSYPACTSSQFKCRSGQCIDSTAHCDGVPDCHDSSDEFNCPRCQPDEFECANGDCVSRSARCDGRSDCSDRSDERNCTVTTCSGDQFRCLDGTCLSIDKRCNHVIDCRNGEDENQCGCAETEFRCTDGRCISYELQCNEVEECSDGSDERDCECPPGEQPCDNGICINKNFFCDNNVDCLDGSDERNCPETGEKVTTAPVICRHDEFTCRDGSCIPHSAVCDGIRHCPSDEDEANCPRGCRKDEFQCSNGDCIRADQKCNRVIDCADGSDESEECDRHVPHPMPGRCPAGYIMCKIEKNCVPQSSLCNGIPECRDKSDEENCDSSERSSRLDLRTYPSEQAIKESK
ncbi:uncharacterized protein LOC143181108 [Calliopsis andreniformis]|uniref:uncharacterized protein LOC143181108 n=1 Tax=Calliopsis andreniformis TaxID=337506 RepID=UPI003FCDE202